MASRTAYINFTEKSLRFLMEANFISAIVRDGEDQYPASMPDFS